MKPSRLIQTPFPAVLDRGRQEVYRAVDRALVAARVAGLKIPGSAAHLVPRLRWSREIPVDSPDFSHAPHYLDRVVAPRFFRGAIEDGVPRLLADREPAACARLVAAADAACAGHFSLLGYPSLQFGEPPDWHLDPVNLRRSPLVHWSRIDALDPDTVGDSKVVWELNRHQWLVTLGQAYRLSGDERYAQAFVGSLSAWMEANPPGIGINWASSLEVSLRLIAWSWALLLFRTSPEVDAPVRARILAWIRTHAAHVDRYLSGFYSPNTHLTGEALGLFQAGVLFGELVGARRWRERGRRILLDQVDRQVQDDGVYFEQSTCYQRYTAEIYLHFLMLSRRNGLPLPSRVPARVRSLLDWLLAVRSPDGTVPQIGDADGGWLLPLSPRDPNDLRGLFALAAVVFGRQDYAWAACGAAPEVAWMLGAQGYEAGRRLRPRPPTGSPTRCFAAGGYVVMRDSWCSNSHHLVFDVGPLGGRLGSGHGHADLLSIQCSVSGRPQIVDPGTFRYGPDREWRDHFRSTFAHSTATIDDAGQAVPAGPFQWCSRPAARLREFTSAPGFDFADAEHVARARGGVPVKHRRRILFVKPRYWIVVDDFHGDGVHEATVRFQLAPQAVVATEDGWIRTLPAAPDGLLLRVFSASPLTCEVVTGAFEPRAGWVSHQYGRCLPAPLASWSVRAQLPLCMVSLLVPQATATAPALRVDFGADGQRSRVRSSTEEVLIGPDDMSIDWFASPAPEREREGVTAEQPLCAG